MADIVCLLKTRFGTQLQSERSKAVLLARRRVPGQFLQQLHHDICRPVTLAFPSAEASLVTHVVKETFIAALYDGKLQLEVMKQEPQNVDAALSHSIMLKAFEQSLAYRGNLVDHDDRHATRQPCTVCAVTGPSEADETVALRMLIQPPGPTKCCGTSSEMDGSFGCRALEMSGAVSSVGCIPHTVLRPPVPAPGHMASDQPGRGGGHRWGDYQRSREMDPCHVCGQVGYQADDCDQR